MKKIISLIAFVILVISCNSARIYDEETYIVGFNDGTYIECIGYDIKYAGGNDMFIKTLDGQQFFDKSQVKFIYIKRDKDSGYEFERISK